MILVSGLDPVEVDQIMPDIIKTLDLGQTRVLLLEKALIYSDKGELVGRGRSMLIVGWGNSTPNQRVLADLSARIRLPIKVVMPHSMEVEAVPAPAGVDLNPGNLD